MAADNLRHAFPDLPEARIDRLVRGCYRHFCRVVIEITETHGELSRLQRLVEQYHAVGLRVAIDDFGAGNSQLDRIIALAPDMIKLDMRLFKMAAKGVGTM